MHRPWGHSQQELLLRDEGLGEQRKGLLSFEGGRGGPGSQKVGGGWVGVSAFSGVSEIGESGGTRGENGGSVEGRVHWMLPWNHSVPQGTPVLNHGRQDDQVTHLGGTYSELGGKAHMVT